MLFLWLATVAARAETLKLHVQDTQGNALENAAILLPEPIESVPDAIAIMDQVNKSFVPFVLVIQRGQQVLFPNSDNIRHHVYSFSPAKPFEIKLYAGEPEQPLHFDTAGIVVLGCNIHDSMVGYIVVADTPAAGLTDNAGNVSLTIDKVPDTLRVWHPDLANATQTPTTLPMPQANSEGKRIIQINAAAPAPAPGSATFGNRFKLNNGK